ncbi:HEAT repeat domain-containing protein [Tychonema sp. LEGE 07199]|uniref:HEAT repeat domain-containing protein n=1 Tax=unclassified Tychonema TaxID=2642144 RepID=UPI00188044FC|nr:MULTISPECIES: HEAT repeat domain-containing protein [unclassified Tychonema]MBE9122849.1 HEAT repeat domain-containing protein [Tychonema sp. LEGE 07199]MBE9131506.1 HEAT repeat domain-containing protein [Tychonema sp. LEGE 07196]
MAELSHSLENLEKIGKDNRVAISAVVKLIASSQQERTHWMLADYLGKIATNNSEAISALVNLIGSYPNETTQLKAATSLGKIEKNNPVAIDTLVNLIRNSQDGYTRQKAVHSLGDIGKDNPVAIETLVELIGTEPDQLLLLKAADILGQTDEYNQIASELLVKIIKVVDEKKILIPATVILNKIGKDSANGMVEALVEIMENTQNDFKWDRVVWCLGNIAKDKQVAIEALVNLINKCDDENILLRAAGRLGDIQKNHPVAIGTLVKLISSSQNKDILWGATGRLGEISKSNPFSISVLVELIRNSCDEHIRCQAAESLEKIDKDNPLVVATLVELIRNSGDEGTRSEAPYRLPEIMKGKHFATAVSGLKDCLTSEISENDFKRYEICYKVIWHCAENMTYPDFYQAWHTQLTNSPIPADNHPHNTDIPTLLKQLQPTDKTFPVSLNIRALEGETDASAIAQELCTQLYQTIFPADTDIPAIRNAPEFKRLIPQLKNRLQKQHIALILHSCPCENALSSFTRKLADTHMGIHIAWITDTPLELPLTNLAADGENLLEAVQNWIAGIGA